MGERIITVTREFVTLQRSMVMVQFWNAAVVTAMPTDVRRRLGPRRNGLLTSVGLCPRFGLCPS